MANTKQTIKAYSLDRYLAPFIALICFVLYANTINHGYVLDDFSIISENTVTTKGISAVPEIFTHFYRYGYYSIDDGIYRPISVAMFAVEWTLSPNNPKLGHWVNVLLYMLTGFVLFKTLSKLLNNYKIVLPFIITLLFIAHPIHTEVVANIKSRDELLGFLFSILSLNFLMNFYDRKNTTALIFGLISFMIALFSKETAITMALIIPLSIYFFRNYSIKQLAPAFIGLLCVVLFFLLVRSQVVSSDSSIAISSLENPLVAAPDKAHQIATAILVLGNYLYLSIFPAELLYDHSFNQLPIVDFTNIFTIISLLIYLGLTIFGIWGITKKNIVAYGILVYLISLSLFSNLFITIGVGMADRFLYFASLGFCFLLGYAILYFTKTELKNIEPKGNTSFAKSNRKVLGISVVIFLFYATKTISRNADWQDNFTLFSADINKLENNAKAHLLLGNELIKNRAPQEQDKLKRDQLILQGISEVKKSLSIYPNNVDAWNTIGGGYFQIDSADQAAYYFEKAVKTNPDDLINLAGLYLAKQEYFKAIELFEKIILKSPDNIDVLVNLGICYGTVKQYGKAVDAFNRAVILAPGNPQLYYYLSTSYKFNGDSINYEKYYQEAFKLDPTLPRP